MRTKIMVLAMMLAAAGLVWAATKYPFRVTTTTAAGVASWPALSNNATVGDGYLDKIFVTFPAALVNTCTVSYITGGTVTNILASSGSGAFQTLEWSSAGAPVHMITNDIIRIENSNTNFAQVRIDYFIERN